MANERALEYVRRTFDAAISEGYADPVSFSNALAYAGKGLFDQVLAEYRSRGYRITIRGSYQYSKVDSVSIS
jgi:deoxyxylulose-5-phosphate synthase